MSLNRKLGGRLQFSVREVARIVLSPRGKAVYVDGRGSSVSGGEGGR